MCAAPPSTKRALRSRRRASPAPRSCPSGSNSRFGMSSPGCRSLAYESVLRFTSTAPEIVLQYQQWAGARGLGDPRARASDRRRSALSHAESSVRPFVATLRATWQILAALRRPNAPCQHRAAELQEPRSAVIHLRVRRERRRFRDARRLTDGGPQAFRRRDGRSWAASAGLGASRLSATAPTEWARTTGSDGVYQAHHRPGSATGVGG
jgi:hypothetical protein